MSGEKARNPDSSELNVEEQNLLQFLKELPDEEFQFSQIPNQQKIHLSGLMNHDLVVSAGTKNSKIYFKLKK